MNWKARGKIDNDAVDETAQEYDWLKNTKKPLSMDNGFEAWDLNKRLLG